MKKIICILLLISQIAIAQKQGNIWYFGIEAGLNFNNTPPTALINGVLSTDEGCASIADANTGALLFYTDGITVWDRNHNAMPFSISTPLVGDPSATQSAVIVSKPGSNNLYYIFSIPNEVKTKPNNPNASMCYRIVDMNLNGGKGDLTSVNAPLMSFATEKIAVVGNCDGSEYWIVGHKWDSDSFYAFKLTTAGLSAPVITKIGIQHTGNVLSSIGYMKFSSNGNKIGLCTYTPLNTMQILDFNTATGVLSNPITEKYIFGSGGDGLYGCSFSPDCTKFYVGTFEPSASGNVYQYDLTVGSTANILGSKKKIATSQKGFGALQNGPDNKMYLAKAGDFTLDVITNPNNSGTACNYVANAVNLNTRTSKFGLPAIVESYLTPPIRKFQVPAQIGPIPNKIIHCANTTTQFIQTTITKFSISPVGTYTISADSSIVTFNPIKTTTYTVITYGDCAANDTTTFTITLGKSPTANFYITPDPPTTNSDPITLTNASIGANSFKWFVNNASVSNNTDYAYSYPLLGLNCYKLVATNVEGCSDSVTKCVTIKDTFETFLFVPNAFTLGNLGINNEFKIKGKNFTLNYFTVYNRYGQQLFTTTNTNVGWDGYQNGLPCDAGIYYYKVKYTDIKKVVHETNGDVLLIK
jgi:gliding motility-associated-like protein